MIYMVFIIFLLCLFIMVLYDLYDSYFIIFTLFMYIVIYMIYTIVILLFYCIYVYYNLGTLLYDIIAKTQFFSSPYLTVITVINVQVKHTFGIEFDVNDCSEESQPISLKMEEKV